MINSEYLNGIKDLYNSKEFKNFGFKKKVSFYLWFAAITLLIIPIIFLTFKGAIIGWLTNDWSGTALESKPTNKIKELLPYFILLLTSISLIIANTRYYYKEFFRTIISDPSSSKNLFYKKTENAYYAWRVITNIFVFALIIILGYTGYQMFSIERLELLHKDFIVDFPQLKDFVVHWLMIQFGHIVHLVEVYIFLVIINFLFIDMFLIEAISSKENKTKEDESELEFVKNQFWFIDFVVLIGLILTFLFTYFALDAKIDKDAPLVFTVGIITMHIVYSQLIFLFLNLRRLINEFVYKLEEHNKKNVTENKTV